MLIFDSVSSNLNLKDMDFRYVLKNMASQMNKDKKEEKPIVIDENFNTISLNKVN